MSAAQMTPERTANDADRPARRSRLLSPASATVLGALVLGVTVASVPLEDAAHQLTVSNVVGEGLSVLVYTAVGVIVARRQPRNPLGWILLMTIFLYVFSNELGTYAVLHYTLGHRGLPLAPVAVVLYPLWALGVALFPLIILLFPEGRLPSRRWKWVLWGYLALCGFVATGISSQAVAAVANHDIHLDSYGDITSGGHPTGILAVAFLASVVLIGLLTLSFVVYQFLSWRRSTGERRQQLKWLAWGAAIAFVTFILGTTFNTTAVGSVLGLGIIALPIAIGIGILKYRLYEIDRLVSRTLAYAIVTGLVVGVYVGVVTLVTKVLGFSSPVAVAASTLAAVALFNPLRIRVQHIVDRRFNRARYDAEATVATFTARLRDAVDLETVRRELLEVVNRAVEPAHASVWIRRRE